MNRIMRTPWWPALAGSLLAAAVVVAAPRLPEPTDVDKEPAAKADKDKAAAKEPAKADKDVDAYVNSLLPKITDRHDSIRDSAREALEVVGEPALPALKKLAEGDDGAAAEAAEEVVARIERGGRRRGGPEFGRGRRGWREGFRGPWRGRRGPRPGERPGGRRGPVGPGGFRGPGMAVESALKDLKLDDKQQTKVEEIVKAHREKVRTEFESMRADLLKEMKGVLTADQYQQFEKSLSETPPGPGGRPGFFGPREDAK